MLEVSYARWRSTIERAADSVVEKWVRAVAKDEEAARVALHLASWWLEAGRPRYATRYALASLALDPGLWRQVDGVLERLAVKSRPPRSERLFSAFVADLEGGE
jgi:hypothetical protein